MGAILLAAAFARLYRIGHEGLWCDEAYTALTVRLPLFELLSRLARTDDAPPLFYLVQKLCVGLVGDSEAGLRAVSAVAGVLSVALLLVRSRRDGPGTPARWSAAFLAVVAFGVFHSRQARSYSLLILLATWFVLSAKDLLAGNRRAAPGLAFSGVLLCLTHHVAILLVPASLILWPLGTERRPRLRTWTLWHLPPLAAWGLTWIFASHQFWAHSELNAWIRHYWQSHSLALAPFASLALFVPGGLPQSELSVPVATLGRSALAWSVLSLGSAVLCLASGLRSSRGAAPGPPVDRSRRDALRIDPARREGEVELGFVLLPLLLLLVVSAVGTPAYVLGRTDVLAYPAFALLIGRGLARLPRVISVATLLLWALVSLQSLAPSYGLAHPEQAKGTDRRLARELAARATPGDWFVHTFMTAPTMEYYFGRPHHLAYFPRVAGENIASTHPTPSDSLDAYRRQAADLRREMEASLSEDGVVWIFAIIEPGSAATVNEANPPHAISVEQLAYPVALLVHALVGREPVTPVFIYHQDWVAGQRVVLRIPRRTWLASEEIEPVQIRVSEDDRAP